MYNYIYSTLYYRDSLTEYYFSIVLSCSASVEVLSKPIIRDMMETSSLIVCIALASFAPLTQPAVAQEDNTTLPLVYPGQVLHGDGSQSCPPEEQRNVVRDKVRNAMRSLLQEAVVPLLQATAQLPIESPSVVHPCGGSGWRRVVYLNMSVPSQQCPSVWQEVTSPHRVCGRRSSSTGSCEGVIYNTSGVQYNRVCGRIIGYQIGVPNGFRGSGRSIDSNYVDGVSVTHGSPRQHIWTFAGGFDETTQNAWSACPCVAGSYNARRAPSFVGQNYFCESGLGRYQGNDYIFWPDGDALWDGQGCGPTSTCCSFNSPPWFNVQLSNATTDDIEVRICNTVGGLTEDTPIECIELYVK